MESDCCKVPMADVESEDQPRCPSWMLYVKLAVALIVWVGVFLLLRPASEWIAFGLLGLAEKSHLGQSVAFFCYDVPKVLMLLGLIVFGVGVLRSFFTPEKTRKLLAGRRESAGNALAAGLGIVTPFCSCSAVPLFIGFVEAGVPLGVTFSFLIAAPMINEVAVVMLFASFGARIAAIYVGTGLIVAIVSGWIIGRMKLERYIEGWVFEVQMGSAGEQDTRLTWEQRLRFGLKAVPDIVGKVWPYVVAGIAVGAGIHGYVPDGVLASFMGSKAWWTVPAAVLIGVPMYSNAAGIVPVVEVLHAKGAALGTSLAFMMAVIGLSLPETIILRKVLKPRLIAAFLGVVAFGILVVGFLFNAVM